MRLSEFILLSENEKKSAVLHQGVLVAKKSTPDCMMFLFQLGSYYVEAICNPANKAIEEYWMFASIDGLKPYWEEISLDDPLN